MAPRMMLFPAPVSPGRITSQLSGNGDSAVPPPPEAFPPLLSEGLLFFPMGVGGIIFLGDRGSPQGGSSSPQTPPGRGMIPLAPPDGGSGSCGESLRIEGKRREHQQVTQTWPYSEEN